jgi:hypothetical protein
MSPVEISPGGIGFIRTNAEKRIPGEPPAVRDAPRRGWYRKAPVNKSGEPKMLTKTMAYLGLTAEDNDSARKHG